MHREMQVFLCHSDSFEFSRNHKGIVSYKIKCLIINNNKLNSEKQLMT